MFHKLHTFLGKRSRACFALASLFAMPFVSLPATATQGLSFTDRFNNAIDAVQAGIDIFWPGDFDSENINAQVGMGFGWTPDYLGSNSYRFRALPIIDIRYKDLWRISGSKISYNVFKRGIFEAGPFVNIHFGRNERTHKALNGLGDIGTTLDLGIFARIKRESLIVELDARRAISEGQGTAIRLTAGHGILQKGNLALAFAVRGRYMSRKGMQTNFGITERQAANSLMGYEPFRAGAGLSEASANLVGAYRVTEKFRVMGLMSVGHLFGDAADSPIVKGPNGSPVQTLMGLGFTMMF